MTKENFSYDNLIENNNAMVNALIDLLIEKGIITEEEFKKKMD